MRVLAFILIVMSLSGELHSQSTSDDEKISRLLTGRKNPSDEDAIASLGVGALDSLVKRLEAEQDLNKLPLYSRLISIKYRQFAASLPASKKARILDVLCSKIRNVRDEGSTAYLIQSALGHLHGMSEPQVLQLAEGYLRSQTEWTRKAAQGLRASMLDESQPAKFEDQHPAAPPIPAGVKKPDAQPSRPIQPNQGSTSSTPWSIIVILIVAASGLLWLVLKRRS
jgi:hypothetical protein